MNEHKENKKPNPNLKPTKGTKNFMSPIISAVSKVNPSPRKKALAERNEAVRTSASLSDGKFLFFAGAGDDDLKSETESCEFQEETHLSTFGAKKRVTFDDDTVVLSAEVFTGYNVDDDNDDVESLFATQLIEPSLDISKTTSFVSLASDETEISWEPRFFRRWRVITWLLFGALLSSLIVSHASPEAADFSGSLHRMKELSITYLPLMPSMISSFKETDEFTPSEFLNFSGSICDANDHFVEHKAPGFLSGEVKFLSEIENGVLEEIKMDSDLQPEQVEVNYSEEDQFVEESEQVEVDSSEEEQFIAESGLPSHSEIESHPNLESNYEEVEQFIDLPSHPEIESHPNLESNHEEVEAQSNTQFEEAELSKLDEPELETDVASEQTHFTEQTEKEDEVDLEESTSYNTIVESGRSVASAQDAVTFTVAILGAAATAISALAMFSKYKKKKAGVEPNSTEQAELLTRKEDSLYAATDSCNPSEMSSYSYSFYDNKREAATANSSMYNLCPDSDPGLQSVISYLRRSKEIAETEISLLKQEKQRLQTQLMRDLSMEKEEIERLKLYSQANKDHMTQVFSFQLEPNCSIRRVCLRSIRTLPK